MVKDKTVVEPVEEVKVEGTDLEKKVVELESEKEKLQDLLSTAKQEKTHLEQENLELREEITDSLKDLTKVQKDLKEHKAKAVVVPLSSVPSEIRQPELPGIPKEFIGKKILFVGLMREASEQFRKSHLREGELVLVVEGD